MSSRDRVKRKLRWYEIVALSFFALFMAIVIFFLILLWIYPDYPIITEDIADYNTEKYPLTISYFPSTIPDNSEVIAFLQYNYWNEDRDYYLELKFKSREEMENYLSEIKDQEVSSSDRYTNLSDAFIEAVNPYNSGYTDLISKGCVTLSMDIYYTGYEIYKHKGEIVFNGNFGSISYSLEELTVIHSYFRGTFTVNENSHIPQYLVRFDVPITETHERKHIIEY